MLKHFSLSSSSACQMHTQNEDPKRQKDWGKTFRFAFFAESDEKTKSFFSHETKFSLKHSSELGLVVERITKEKIN